MTLSCAETVSMLSGFVDGELDSRICDDIKEHLSGCSDCKVVFDSFNKTITIYRHLPELDVPQEVTLRLTDYLKKQIDPRNSDS